MAPQEGGDGSACARVMLHSLAEPDAAPLQATDGAADVTSVCWSADGKYLYYAASAYSFGPEMYGLDMSTQERPVLRSLYVTVLAEGQPLPFPLRSDDEAPPPTPASLDEGLLASSLPHSRLYGESVYF